jgi:hypothetical protein
MTLARRQFLSLFPTLLTAAAPRNRKADIAILGGGTGGCAAALGALRNGASVILTEETLWLGGQMTSQLVSAFDEHPWIEAFGATRAYRDFRNAIRAYYRQHYPLTGEAHRRPNLNPGGGTVSNFAVEPRVVVAVLEALLAPYASGGRLTVLLRHKPVAADTSNDRIRAVTIENIDTKATCTIEAGYFLDATELGDLLPLTKTEYVTGFESQKMTGEPSAPAEPQLGNEQAITHCFAVDYIHGEDHTIDKPKDYDFWRDYIPKLTPPWPGKLLSWKMSNPRTLASRDLFFDPRKGPGGRNQPLNLWTYRRIANKANFEPRTYPSDISLINWPQNDYWLGRLIDVSPEEQAKHVEGAKQLSLSLLYWMQTDQKWKGLRLRHDIAGTEDGMAMAPYIRESRRIQAEFTVTEQHVSTTAEAFPDSVGVGSYRIDLHPTTTGDNYLDVSSLPFQIPLGALIPKRVENLLPACKNLGVTHITNGCYRLHPVEWNIGESAGVVAAYALRTGHKPRHLRSRKKLLEEFQLALLRQGIEVAWPKLSPR